MNFPHPTHPRRVIIYHYYLFNILNILLLIIFIITSPLPHTHVVLECLHQVNHVERLSHVAGYVNLETCRRKGGVVGGVVGACTNTSAHMFTCSAVTARC